MSTLHSELCNTSIDDVKPTASDTVQGWLVASAGHLRAHEALALVRQGDKNLILGSLPQFSPPNSKLATVARQALIDGAFISRSEDTDEFTFAFVGVRVRIAGRPSSIAFRLLTDRTLSDQELFDNVRKIALRRVDDNSFAPQGDSPTVSVPSLVEPNIASRQSHVAVESHEEAIPVVPSGIANNSLPTKDSREDHVESDDDNHFDPTETVVLAVPGASANAPEKRPSQMSEKLAPKPATNSISTAESDALRVQLQRQGAALELIASIVDRRDNKLALRALVDAIAVRFDCSQVTLGTRRSRKVVVDAVSGAAGLDSQSSSNLDIAIALDETVDKSAPIILPIPNDHDSVPAAHSALAATKRDAALLSVPLLDGDKVFGAIMLERPNEFRKSEVEELAQLALLAAPLLVLKKDNEMGVLRRSLRGMKKATGQLFGFNYLNFKLAVICLLALVIWSTQYSRVFNIDATASIEATVQRAVVAGSSSYVSQVEKRAGDVVYKGDVLARLDVEDLQLELIKWKSERDKLSKEQRAVLAQRDRTRVRILSAKYAQAQTQIEYLQAQIGRAVLRAPIDGVVVSGDLSEALGSPVERGQLLFEVASLSDHRLILQVDEADISAIDLGYVGRLRLKSLPQNTYKFEVTSITPVAEALDGMNRFRLEAKLLEVPPNIRPGMAGIAKIEAGEHAIGWIWTRSFVNWVRLQVWKLGGV